MARRRRPLTIDAYIRLWSYMSPEDQVRAVCWFSQVHDSFVTDPEGLENAVSVWLNRFGIIGDIVQAVIDAFDLLRPSDVLECDRVLDGGA